jgi:superfamily II RNA helicase
MMNGKPQCLTSKFKISYNLILNLLDIGDNNLVSFAKKSMVTGDLDNQMKDVYYKITSLNGELDNIKNCCTNLRTPISVLEQFIELQKNRLISVNKKRKDIERQLQQIHDSYKYIEQDKSTYQKIELKQKEINEYQFQFDNINSFIKSGVGQVLSLLKNDNFVEGDFSDEATLKLTFKGKIGSQLREIHCLVFSDLLDSKRIDHLSSKQLVALFSCFTNISVQDDFKEHFPYMEDKLVNDVVSSVATMYSDYQKKEVDYGICTGTDYNIHFDLLRYINDWCDAESVEDCKILLQKLCKEKEIFLGEFVKALLKINNISNEMEKIAELTGNVAFLSKLREIPMMTMKYVVTNQSLYV